MLWRCFNYAQDWLRYFFGQIGKLLLLSPFPCSSSSLNIKQKITIIWFRYWLPNYCYYNCKVVVVVVVVVVPLSRSTTAGTFIYLFQYFIRLVNFIRRCHINNNEWLPLFFVCLCVCVSTIIQKLSDVLIQKSVELLDIAQGQLD